MKLENFEIEFKNIFEKKEEIVAGYIYGSSLYSKDPEDIDVGLLLKEEYKPHTLYEAELANELEKLIKKKCKKLKPIDVRILNGKSLRFLFSILKNAKLIYSKDEVLRTAFESKIIKEYLDIKPHYDVYDEMRYLKYANK